MKKLSSAQEWALLGFWNGGYFSSQGMAINNSRGLDSALRSTLLCLERWGYTKQSSGCFFATDQGKKKADEMYEKFIEAKNRGKEA